METKVCKQCLEEKPLTSEYWHKNPGTKDGYCGKCKICRSKNNVEYRKTHKHKIKMRVIYGMRLCSVVIVAINLYTHIK